MRRERRFRKWQTALPCACWFFLIRVVRPHKAGDATPLLCLLSQASSLLRVAPPLCSGWISLRRTFVLVVRHLNVSGFGLLHAYFRARQTAVAERQVPKFRACARIKITPPYIPDTAWSAIQDFFQTCPGNAACPRFRCHLSLFDTSSVVHFRSSSLTHTKREIPRAFP